MPIEADLSDLPRAEDPDKDNPDQRLDVAERLVQLLAQHRFEIRDPDKRPKDAAPFWASMVGDRCARQLHYRFTGVEREPPTIVQQYRW